MLAHYFVPLLALLLVKTTSSGSDVDTGKNGKNVDVALCLVWGPGLKTDFVVPARYFYIQAVDKQGENFTVSAGAEAFTVNLWSSADPRVRVWKQVLDRHDGTYIVRFRLYKSYRDLRVDVQHQGQHVAGSPYTMPGVVYHDKCDCPEASLPAWLNTMDCPASYPQIKRDLSVFPSINMSESVDEAVARFNQKGAHSLCHYVVQDNKIYRRTFGEHVGFKMFMDAILLSLTRKVHLPDIEFLINLGDWPLEKRKVSEKILPIMSWCGSEDTRDIIMPTYDLTESTLETMGRVSLDMLSVQANTGPKWHNKTDIAFWRGRDSRQERLDLVVMSRQNPDLIDAKMTNMFFFKKDPEKYGDLVKHISFFDFFKHKYQINLDGTVAAYRMPYLLAGDSLILKQDSPYYEHFYKDLQPGVHYLSIKRDLSDLLEKIRWARDNPTQAEQIALAGQRYARDKLLARDVFCYHALLFKDYSSRLVATPVVRDDMELVAQDNSHESKCDCHRKHIKDEL